jgi:glycerol-3-phosphate dehydrogenase
VPSHAGSPKAAFDRSLALGRLGSEQFDILVIGGGITGCGVALDAAARGLKTALVEVRDFASGTSSKSSKMVHGGLRYLQQHDYLLVYEALHERQHLLHNAPHLVHPLPFLIPLFGRDGVVSKSVAKAYSGALWLYDLTGGIRIGKRHRQIKAQEALEHFPSLRTDRLVAAFLYWDAQADDARLTLALARTAATYGAVVANYAPVDELVEAEGRVRGARLADGTVVRARTVINAGGVWSEQVRALGTSSIGVRIRPAKGIHVAVPADRLPCDYASVLVVPGDRRSIFVVPWAADEAAGTPGGGAGRYTYIGTTDTDYDGPLDDPRCTPEDIDYLLSAVNAWTGAGLTPQDVTGTWAGLRPLISDARSARTADLSRRHRVMVSDNGLVTVTGGKLTTYRKMAADTVDAATGSPRSRLPLRWPGSITPSTEKLVLVGGEDGGRPPTAALSEARRLAIPEPLTKHLAGRHGSETGAVLELCRERPDLATAISPELPYLRAEVVYAAREEMAQTVTDVLSRRMRALILNRTAAAEAAPDVARLLAGEKGWTAEEEAAQVGAFLREVKAEEVAASRELSEAAGPAA